MSSRRPVPAGPRILTLVRLEYGRILRGRTVKLCVGMMVYALAGVAFLVAQPQPDLMRGIQTWFGAEASELKLFLFLWTDGAMNKLAVLFGSILAGGIITEERARRSLPLFLSKPIRPAAYYLSKLAAAIGVYLTLYLACTLAGVVVFTVSVEAFEASAFVILSTVHAFATVFAVALAGAFAVTFRRRLTAILVSISVLFLFVGSAFIGFYAPSLALVSQLNPFFHGVRLLAVAERLSWADAPGPVAAILGFVVLTVAAGAWQARRVEA